MKKNILLFIVLFIYTCDDDPSSPSPQTNCDICPNGAMGIELQNIIDGTISIKMIKSEDPNYTKDNPQRRCPDLSLIKKSVNYEPKINLEEGLKRIYMWYRRN